MKIPMGGKHARKESNPSITRRLDYIDRRLRNLCDAMRKSHENEREILTWVSDETEKHQPRDGRRISTIKRNMTYVTARTIHTAAPDKATSIGLKFFNTFKESPGAYTNFRSFMKQVHRTLSTFKTQF